MSLDALFQPRAIAIIGASSKERSVGNDIVENLVKQGFAGQIYPINPKIDSLHGLRAYHSVAELPGQIDLAILAIPANLVSQEIEQAVLKGAKAALVISAGFKEVGQNELEQELIATCQKLKITLAGPNCLGVINPSWKMNASFAGIMPPVGDIAFLSQSGALCTAVLDYAQNLGIGFSKFLSTGNKALLKELELIKYLHNDPKTKVICIYAESLENAPEIIKTLRDLNRGDNPKPIIVLKSGKTNAGAKAVASHTGSLSSDDSAYQALFDQAGIIRASSVSELFDLAQVFSLNQIQEVKKVAIVTNAGGPGVLTTDAVIENGLELAKITDSTTQKLKSFLPSSASVHNPIDVLGDAMGEVYEQAIRILMQAEEVEALIVLLTPQSMTEPAKVAEAVVKMRAISQKPIVVSLMGRELVAEGVQILRQNKIANLTFPEPTAKALAKFAKFHDWIKTNNEADLNYKEVNKDRVAEIFANLEREGRKSLIEIEALEVMRAYGFPLLKSFMANSALEIINRVKEFDKPLAIKVVSKDILHKSDVGGVALNIDQKNIIDETKMMLKRVKKNQPQAKIDGILMMEMADKGTELILGINKNSLGTMIMFGLGGIYVEVLKDVAFAFAPLQRIDATDLIQNLRAYKILTGVRGLPAVNQEAIVDALGRLSQLVSDFPQIKELDINPLLANEDGVKILDARIILD